MLSKSVDKWLIEKRACKHASERAEPFDKDKNNAQNTQITEVSSENVE